MEPLICPQCGGQITSYSPGQTFTTCQYCSTTFVIESNKQRDVAPEQPFTSGSFPPRSRPQVMIGVMVAAFAVIGFFVFIALVGSTRPVKTLARSTPFPSSTYSRTASPTPTPDPNILEFGSAGTANGLFKDANTISVDPQGRIYVGDDTLRIQQFDKDGKFLKLWQAPAKTINYKKARTIDKIASGDDGKLYAAVGGVIQTYDDTATEPVHTFHVAPDYIQDFAIKSDGSMLMISTNDEIETLMYVSKSGKIARRIRGFHTEAADASLDPPQTALSAIRLAVDGAGNIFSVYAFGDLGGYSLSYNTEELLIFRFTPDGRYVNKFVESMNSCGIAVDSQSRIYVSDGGALINVYTENGQPAGSISGLSGMNAFALDKDNNIYVLFKDRVIKRPPIS